MVCFQQLKQFAEATDQLHVYRAHNGQFSTPPTTPSITSIPGTPVGVRVG